ncbi:AraC family transcriptional regulator [Cohnella sp. REN36]|uniref:AraC family transcriptional regulator n=1 Tax=Cohnella sp. REN36 TaxID=2887347 RepID=UPI001D151124|nr:AraC family transcriptional regulator [Cohnella sp. REN36]MCC3374833.1 AraC family transcriptional regulator [Cohnella sp. REN36]
MTSHYFTILMNHLEHMQVELTAASETGIDPAAPAEEVNAYDCNRILLVTGGRGALRLEDRTEPLAPGTCSILQAGVPHALEADASEPLTYKWCHFRASYAERELYKILRIPTAIRFDPWDEPAALLDRIAAWTSQAALTSRLRMKAALLDLIGQYLERSEFVLGDVTPSPEMIKIETVLRHIEEHLADSITIEELAGLVFLHPNYFIVFFKGMMGCSPIQYVNQRRMETARTLLAQPEWNVSDVAARIGMKIYYFSRMFKSHTGLTPSRYRKLAASGSLGSGLSGSGETEAAAAEEGPAYGERTGADETAESGMARRTAPRRNGSRTEGADE